jgi:hypothetical protein
MLNAYDERRIWQNIFAHVKTAIHPNSAAGGDASCEPIASEEK